MYNVYNMFSQTNFKKKKELSNELILIILTLPIILIYSNKRII